MRTEVLKKTNGMSLVEVMVGLVIGMIVVLVIYQIEVTFEGQKRTTTEGAGAQENGLYAVNMLERDIRMTGWGLTGSPLLGCTTSINAIYNGSAIPNFSLMPIQITDGGTQPDTINLMSGSSMMGNVPGTIASVLNNASAELVLNSTVGFNQNDMVLVANPDGTCTYGQITHVQSSPNHIQRNPGLSLYNPTGGTRSSTWAPEQVGAKIYDFGIPIQRQYSVNNLTLQSQDLGAASAISLADNIVSIKAQYGVTVGGGSQAVTTWVNATGSWAAPIATDVARIKAVRLFVIARSPLIEKQNAGVCNTTTAVPAPTWTGGSTIVVDLSAVANWQCFRYKTFQTVIPLRNVIWANM